MPKLIYIIGDKLVTIDNIETAINIAKVNLSTIDFLPSLIIAFKINTHTQTLTPLNAWITIGKSAKLVRNAAINVIIITDGVITPKVAIIPPIIPAIL